MILEEILSVILSFLSTNILRAKTMRAIVVATAAVVTNIEVITQVFDFFIISSHLSLTSILVTTSLDLNLQEVSLKITPNYSNIIANDICNSTYIAIINNTCIFVNDLGLEAIMLFLSFQKGIVVGSLTTIGYMKKRAIATITKMKRKRETLVAIINNEVDDRNRRERKLMMMREKEKGEKEIIYFTFRKIFHF